MISGLKGNLIIHDQFHHLSTGAQSNILILQTRAHMQTLFVIRSGKNVVAWAERKCIGI